MQISNDPETDIIFLRIAGMGLKFTALTEPLSRPRKRSNKLLSLGLNFANVEDVAVFLNGFEAERMASRYSIIQNRIIDHFKDQLWKVVVNVLDFYLTIGGVSQVIF